LASHSRMGPGKEGDREVQVCGVTHHPLRRQAYCPESSIEEKMISVFGGVIGDRREIRC